MGFLLMRVRRELCAHKEWRRPLQRETANPAAAVLTVLTLSHTHTHTESERERRRVRER